MDKCPGLATLNTAPAAAPSATGGGGGSGGGGGGSGGGGSPAGAAGGAAADGSENGASTQSTVAIDNKIEQAMDLVKSHLMFAVREEVEVLKEKITELLDRISQLEYENMVLRQYATQEALQKIQQHHASNT